MERLVRSLPSRIFIMSPLKPHVKERRISSKTKGRGALCGNHLPIRARRANDFYVLSLPNPYPEVVASGAGRALEPKGLHLWPRKLAKLHRFGERDLLLAVDAAHGLSLAPNVRVERRAAFGRVRSRTRC